LIFVVMGPLWIVMGLVPGRPLGFEKWLRIVFANLAVFPLVAFLLVFARVIVDSAAAPAVLGAATSAAAHGGSVLAAATQATPQNVFYPPLIGNPSISTFTTILGFGAIMMAPTVPSLIKDQMKATGPGGKAAAAAAFGGLSVAAAAATSAPKKMWGSLNKRNPTTGAPEGALAIRRAQLARKLPGTRRFIQARDIRRRQSHAAYMGDIGHDEVQDLGTIKSNLKNNQTTGYGYSRRSRSGETKEGETEGLAQPTPQATPTARGGPGRRFFGRRRKT
jgi:hypothetical protein